jgi:hypothetical protein
MYAGLSFYLSRMLFTAFTESKMYIDDFPYSCLLMYSGRGAAWAAGFQPITEKSYFS